MKKNDIKKARSAVKTTARKEGISVENVREEMKAAIAEGMKSGDPAVQAMWQDVPSRGRGEVPEPEELIAWLAEQVRERMKK